MPPRGKNSASRSPRLTPRIDTNGSVVPGSLSSSPRADDVRRVVERVSAHYVPKILSLMRRNQELEEENALLKSTMKSAEFQRGIDDEHAPRCSAQTRSADGASNCDIAAEVLSLRNALRTERIQRLRVEEQTQLIAEQHAHLLGRLEARLQKREAKAALEGHNDANSVPSAGGSPSLSMRRQEVEVPIGEPLAVEAEVGSQRSDNAVHITSTGSPSAEAPHDIKEIAAYLERLSQDLLIFQAGNE